MVVAETSGGANTAYAIKIAENHKAGVRGIPTLSEKAIKEHKTEKYVRCALCIS